MPAKRPPLQAALMKAVTRHDQAAMWHAIEAGADPAFRGGEAAQRLAEHRVSWLFNEIADQSGPTHQWAEPAQRLLLSLAASRNDRALARRAIFSVAGVDFRQSQAVANAIDAGHLRMAEWLWARWPRPMSAPSLRALVRTAALHGQLRWVKRAWQALLPAAALDDDAQAVILLDAITLKQRPMIEWLMAPGRIAPDIWHLEEAMKTHQPWLVELLKRRVDWFAHSDQVWDAHCQAEHPSQDLLLQFPPLCPWRRDFLEQAIAHGDLVQLRALWALGYRSAHPATPRLLSLILQCQDPEALRQLFACSPSLDLSDPVAYGVTLDQGLFRKPTAPGQDLRKLILERLDMTPLAEMMASWTEGTPRRRRHRKKRLQWLLSQPQVRLDWDRVLIALAYFGHDDLLSPWIGRCDLLRVARILKSGKVGAVIKQRTEHKHLISERAWSALDALGCQVDAVTQARWLERHRGKLPRTLAHHRLKGLNQCPAVASSRMRPRS